MKYIFPLLLVVILFISGCNKVNSDPIKGAEELCEELSSAANSDNYDEVCKTLSEYLNAYKNNDNLLFLMAFRNELMSPAMDKVADHIASADYDKYPVYKEYIQKLISIASKQALSSKEHHGYPAEQAYVFCSLMKDYAESNNYDEAIQTISTVNSRLASLSEWARIEFFMTFQNFVKNSGEPGIKIFRFLQSDEINTKPTIDFMRMALESFIQL